MGCTIVHKLVWNSFVSDYFLWHFALCFEKSLILSEGCDQNGLNYQMILMVFDLSNFPNWNSGLANRAKGDNCISAVPILDRVFQFWRFQILRMV